MMQICPIMSGRSALAAYQDGPRGIVDCMEARCMFWDPGINKSIVAGCGLVPRDSRRY